MARENGKEKLKTCFFSRPEIFFSACLEAVAEKNFLSHKNISGIFISLDDDKIFVSSWKNNHLQVVGSFIS